MEVAVRLRLLLTGEGRFRWKTGSKPCLYGQERLATSAELGYIVLTEGESDCHVLWYHKIPALGLPGANCWREDWAGLLDIIPTIYVIIEPDQGGRAIENWIRKSRIRSRVRLVRLASAKDPSDLYLADPDGFPAALQVALESSVRWVRPGL